MIRKDAVDKTIIQLLAVIASVSINNKHADAIYDYYSDSVRFVKRLVLLLLYSDGFEFV